MKTTALKTFIAIFCIAALSATVKAQAPKAKPSTAQSSAAKSSATDWKELDDFHQLMAQTFHPVVDAGDFKPIREHSEELFEKARLLSESKIPAQFSTKEMMQTIQELNLDCRRLNAMVKDKASDEEIRKTLTAAHDTFHKIMETCEPGKHREHMEHHDKNDSNHQK
jgi:hypothetical protein